MITSTIVNTIVLVTAVVAVVAAVAVIAAFSCPLSSMDGMMDGKYVR